MADDRIEGDILDAIIAKGCCIACLTPWTKVFKTEGKRPVKVEGGCPNEVCVLGDWVSSRPRSAGTTISPVEPRVKCSFCDKSQDDVEQIVAGPNSVYICNECVTLCNDIMAPGSARSRPAGE